ncbi:hypothetical protein MMC15_003974 [Xylographa vitiligo]|nr:hypothetical protein [Xylographa vitiligo]
MSSQYNHLTQMADLQRFVDNLQEALASRVEEVASLRQEVATAVEQRDTLALFLAPRRYLLEEESHDLARDCLAIVEELFGAVPEAPEAPAPTTPPPRFHHPAADAAISRGSSWNRDAPSSLLHHHQPQHHQAPPPPTALPPSPMAPLSAPPRLVENDYHMVVYGIPLRPLSQSGPGPYYPPIAATTTTTTLAAAAAAAHRTASPPSAPVSLASSPGPATPTPPRAQKLAATNTAAATAGTTASERAAGSAELRRLDVMARNMEEGEEEAEMRDRGSPVPRNRAERTGFVWRGGIRDRRVNVMTLPPPRIVWPGE